MATEPELPGLTRAEVAERVARGQVNEVPSAPTRTLGEIVRANVFTRFNALLGAMLVVILIVGPVQDMLFGGVLLANALIGILQELRAKRTLDRLTLLTAPKARVIREGVTREVALGKVVLDDDLELRPGDQVVVDGAVLRSDTLEVDESLLTGEAEPIRKDVGDAVLSGSFVAAGSGVYRATRVGRGAYATRLAEEARRFTLTRSELRAAIDRILGFVAWAIAPTAILLFVSQLLRTDEGFRSALRAGVAGTVAMVPEGLVLLTSVAFAVGVIRLGRRRVLVQELPAVEGLARVDVLCIDKTGTLTEGRLVVEEVHRLDDAADPAPVLAALAAADPNPNATLRAIGERFPPSGDWNPAGSVPFSSSRRWSAVWFERGGPWVLGAPDELTDGIGGGERELVAKAEEQAALGRRVLLLARTLERPSPDGHPKDLEPAALVILGDRPRDDAARTLAYFAEQGVTVKVISGDHPATVGAIARRVGAAGAGEPIDARSLPEDEEGLAQEMERANVFGRVTPHQKQAMVRALRSRGHVVAMTGDGVNDVLALKEADIGVGMGSGAPATRAVAQLVLLDSNFGSLPPVVLEGRRVLGNIERTSGLYLTKTVYAMLLALAVGVAGLPFPFLPRHLTLVGSLTIGIPSFILALEPNTARARPGFLRRVTRFAVPAGILATAATFLAYVLAGSQPGVTLAEQRTTATMVLAWIRVLVLSIIAAPLTRRRLLLVWTMAALFLAAMLLPPAGAFFALDPPALIVWLAGFGIAAIVWSFAHLFVPGGGPIGSRAEG